MTEHTNELNKKRNTAGMKRGIFFEYSSIYNYTLLQTPIRASKLSFR